MGQDVPLYRDSGQPVEARVADLLSRMTLMEKARQMDMYPGASFVDRMSEVSRTAVAHDGRVVPEKLSSVIGGTAIGCIHDLYPPDASIPNEIQRYCIEETRLGIPVLFSEEALHGICAPGSTIFPQIIGLASSWDVDLVRRVGRAIASETRSRGIHLVFAPMLDVCRDPRWGRIEEGYGEDTELVSRLGLAMVNGMQGADLRDHASIVAEPKHFGAHGVPQGGRNTHAVSLGEREMRSMLEPFRRAVVDGKAQSIMCAYHSNDGVPCAADPWLLTEVLRGEWGFDGFVCSDLGAIRRLHTTHRTASSPEDAIAQAVAAGMDMQFFDYDQEFFQRVVVELVESGRLALEAVDRAVAGILRVKFRLGLFDRPYVDPALAGRVNRSASHLALSLEAARKGICLLKNADALLPIRGEIRSIAVIGPNAHVGRTGDYSAVPHGFTPTSVLDGIRSLAPQHVTVEHCRGTGIVDDELEPVAGEFLLDPRLEAGGLLGEYYASDSFSGEPCFSRVDPGINFNWVLTTPDPRLPSDRFCARWRGWLTPPESERALLGVSCLDDVRLWVDDELIVDTWGVTGPLLTSRAVALEAGVRRAIRLEYRKRSGGGSVVQLGWQRGRDAREESMREAAELAARADLAVLVVGDSDATCGESKDRADLALPGRQAELVDAVVDAVEATGTPVVLVLINGRPPAIERQAERAAAVVEAWYPGDRGGTAVAEVLFGRANPAGRLPVTFPRSVGQLPLYASMLHYTRQGYVDQAATPLYAFGHGLSYASFACSDLEVVPPEIDANSRVTVSVTVRNTGEVAGDEVVRLYVSDRYSSVARPECELKRFARVHLDPGAEERLSFTLTPTDLELLDARMMPVVEPGVFDVHVDGGGAGVRGSFSVCGGSQQMRG